MIKKRNIALWIVLSIVTCGIAGWVWFVGMTDDLNTVSGEEGTSGGLSLLLLIVTCNIYGFYWAYKAGEKLDTAKQNRGEAPSNNSIMYMILFLFFGIVAYAIIQDQLNKMAVDVA